MSRSSRILLCLVSVCAASLSILSLAAPPRAATQSTAPIYGFKIVKRYPHDPAAYTEGLFYEDGYLYESTGVIGSSSVRKVELDTGKVIQQAELPGPWYGEGMVSWHQKLIQLTWKEGIGIVYDRQSLKPMQRFTYTGEGWALTKDSTHIYMSDGTSELRVLDPDSLKKIASIHVNDNGVPVTHLNDLESVKGEIYANVWLTDRIARIDPSTGHVTGWIDLKGLFDYRALSDPDDVLNGIAYDSEHDRLFVTGKRWPSLFEIQLVP